ncbi:MAG: hypothetical protein IT374_12260 [Polyangiaceae bacterium]|nr:hypothetical protein [Polyangiaceae bacterium]
MTTDADFRREVLTELAPVLREALASHAWGRLLVHTARRDDGSLRVSDLEVDDVIGPEADIERAMGAPDTPSLLPVLATAVEALASTWSVDVDDVGGGTFVRDDEGAFHHLPGLVRAPSAAVDLRAAAALAWASSSFAGLGLGEDATLVEVDPERAVAVWQSGDARRELRCVVLGTFARASWTLVWAHANPSLPEAARARCHEALDAFTDRAVWEVSTPQLATDERTAWTLAALVAEDARLAPVAVRQEQGTLFLLLEAA